MKIKLACLGLGALLAATGAAQAGDFSFGPGFKDRVEVPAPIPVPAPMPVPEGFTYYLRADLGYGVSSSDPSFSENGRIYGNGPGVFTAAAPFVYGQSPQFAGQTVDVDHVLTYGFGAGAYFTPHLRGDLTLEFRGKQGFDINSAYSYVSTSSGNTINGTVNETFRVNGTLGLINLYFDLLPRGRISPYVGAGVGFIYNDIDRRYVNVDTEAVTLATQTITGSSKASNFGLAAALMAGVTFAIDHKWALDVNYRALFLDGGSVTTSLSTAPATVSKATLDDHWEHQVRVGLRFNIW